jgi:pimeloyl-ACP methyl ester carboxylesterase
VPADPAAASTTIEAGGLSFRARVAGPEDGRPVFLLHGFPQTSACWFRQVPALVDAGCRVVAYDQRGYSPGARPAEVEAYASARFVDDLLAIADALGVGRFDLVGHDLGGAVAWTAAGTHPERLRSLTVVSTPHPAAFKAAYSSGSSGSSGGGEGGDAGDQHQKSGYIRTFKESPRGEIEAALLADGAAALRMVYDGLPPDAVEEYVSVLSAPGALQAAVDWYRASSGRVSAATPPSPVATLYVWGDQDQALGRAAAEATAAHVTGPYRFEVIGGGTHWLPELSADQLNPLLLAHLAAT